VSSSDDYDLSSEARRAKENASFSLLNTIIYIEKDIGISGDQDIGIIVILSPKGEESYIRFSTTL